MKFENIYETPMKLINDLANYDPYIIKVKCFNREESDWFQTRYYKVLYEKYLSIKNIKFPIHYIEKITFKTKDKVYGKCEYEFTVSDKYYEKNIKKERKVFDENGKQQHDV